MRIALVNKVISQSGGGGERYAADLATALIELGHEVHLYAAVIEDVPSAAVRHPLRLPGRPGFCRILGFARNARIALERDKPAYQFDIVYGLTQVYPVDIYFMGGGMHQHWLKIRTPNPILRLLRCLFNPTHLAQMWLEKQILHEENCRRVISNSRLVKTHAALYGGVRPERVSVVHNGVDRNVFNTEVRQRLRAEARAGLSLNQKDLALIFMAHNWPRKGLATVIRALALAGDAGARYRLYVVGKGSPKPFLQLARDCGLGEDRIRFLSSVNDPQRIYAAGDVFVLPTIYDPCAGVTVEAMACGLPVITTTDNGAHELVRHGETGYVMQSPSDATGLAGFLCELTDDARRERMGRQAGEDIAPRSFMQVVRESVAVMQEVLAEREAATPSARANSDASVSR